MDSKIAEITRTPGSTKLNLKFQYDALGNRVAKHTFAANGIWRTSEFYVRDASGNLSSSYCLRQRTIRDANPDRNVSGMATYKHYPQAQEMHYQLTERHIYGSARIGTENSCLELIANSTEIDIREFSRTINLKSYEIANHLGNVISTVSDLKIPVDISNDNITDSYSAIIISATDYSPFGAALDYRSFQKENYRFGFNGKELDNSTATDNYDFGARILDTRLGRWSSVDACFTEYSALSTYCFVANSPLQQIDPDGNKIRGSISVRIDLIRFKVQTARRIKEAIKNKDLELANSLTDQLIALGELKNSERIYHFDRKNFEQPDSKEVESGEFTITPNLDRNKKKGRIDIQYTMHAKNFSLAGAVTVADLFENKSMDLIEGLEHLSNSMHVFDKVDCFKIERARGTWADGGKLKAQERLDRLNEILNSIYRDLPNEDLKVDSPHSCENLPGLGKSDLEYKCTQEYILSGPTSMSVYIDGAGKFSSRFTKSKENVQRGIEKKDEK